MPQRVIKLVHLIDGGIRSFIDDGCSKSGEPNNARQQLIIALEKLVLEKDENGNNVLDEDGIPREINVFRLAEQPPKMPYNLSRDDEAAIARRDDFDRKYLKRDGEWLRPSERWSEQSERFKAKRQDKHDEYGEKTRNAAQQEAGAVLSKLIELAKQPSANGGNAPASSPTTQDSRSPPPPAGSLAATGAPGTGPGPLVESMQHITTPDPATLGLEADGSPLPGVDEKDAKQHARNQKHR